MSQTQTQSKEICCTDGLVAMRRRRSQSEQAGISSVGDGGSEIAAGVGKVGAMLTYLGTTLQ